MESFDTVSEFMINPEHSHKDYGQLMKEFEESGGKMIGFGRFGLVYSHPKWPYVLKIFNSDDAYLKFVRYAYDNPHPSFPKFYGKPQRINPKYITDKHAGKRYLTRIEKLEPVSEEFFNKLDLNLSDYFKFKENPELVTDQNKFSVMESTIKSLPKEICNLLEGKYLIERDISDAKLDMHDGNIMIGKTGQYVWTDPVFGEVDDEENIMYREMYQVLLQHVNKTNSTLENAEIEILDSVGDGIHDIYFTFELDISKCSLGDVELDSEQWDSIAEMFSGGDLMLEMVECEISPKNLEIYMRVINSPVLNIKDSVGYVDMIPDFMEWVNTELYPDLCEHLHNILGVGVNESSKFDQQYYQMLEEFSS